MILRVLLLASFISAAAPVDAAEAWLLIFRDRHYEVVHASPRGIEPALRCGNYALYADTTDTIAVASRDTRSGRGVLSILSKGSGSVVATWPILAFPAMQLSGASSDLVITGDFAVFPAVRNRAGGFVDPNVLGGSFDIVRVSLIDGVEHVTPLPREILNPRLSLVGGQPLVSNGVADLILRLDVSSGELEKLSSDSPELRAEDFPWLPYSRQAAVKNAEETLSAEPSKTRLFSSPATRSILSIRTRKSGSALAFLDPTGSKALRAVEVDSEIVPESVLAISEDSAAFIDRKAARVWVATKNSGPKVVWNLRSFAPDITAVDSRVLSATL